MMIRTPANKYFRAMARTTPIKRSGIKHKPKRDPMPSGRRMEIFERDSYCCRHCGYAVAWEAGNYYSGHAHHIIFRSQSVDHSVGNLILLCPACHDLIHARKLWIDGDASTARFTTERP